MKNDDTPMSVRERLAKFGIVIDAGAELVGRLRTRRRGRPGWPSRMKWTHVYLDVQAPADTFSPHGRLLYRKGQWICIRDFDPSISDSAPVVQATVWCSLENVRLPRARF